MRSHQRNTGFTLLELIITIAIAGILTGIAVPNYLSYLPKARLKGAATTVRADLMAARMKAVKLKKKTKIFFLNDHEYKICDDADGDLTVDEGEGDALLKDIEAEYTGVTFSSTNNPIFNPRGTASNLATVTFTNASGARTLTISITGIVRLN